MRRFLVLATTFLVMSSMFFPEYAISAQKINHSKVLKQKAKSKKVAKYKQKNRKLRAKASKYKIAKHLKAKPMRVRYARYINNPKDGEILKIENIAKDFLKNEQ